MLAVIINGVFAVDGHGTVDVSDRGLQYGDGLFETMRLRHGRIRFLEEHLQRLYLGCERLKIEPPNRAHIEDDLLKINREAQDGIIKIIATRGSSGRGYRPLAKTNSTRIVALYPYPPDMELNSEGNLVAIHTRWCKTRLARNPLLAGIKHLNRLEQVLAQLEWSDSSIAEGLMLDLEGELISATAGNIFLVRDGVLCTPDLRFSGIRGVMRAQVLLAAQALQIPIGEGALWPQDLLDASEVFVSNAVRGIRPVIALDERYWPIGVITKRLSAAIALE